MRQTILGSMAAWLIAGALGAPAAGIAAPPAMATATAAPTPTPTPADHAVDNARRLDSERQARLARDVESFGKATRAPDALILAARLWATLGALRDRDRALDLATRTAAGDAALLKEIAAVRAATGKGVLVAPPLSLAPGESATTRRWVGSGSARARVTASLPLRIGLIVTDHRGAELCSATGSEGGAECAWTAPWEGDVTLSVVNLGEDRLSAWTITRSSDNNIGWDEGAVKWR